jgi:tripartite-type tricarboxylate transporter receptor subunit TctC
MTPVKAALLAATSALLAAPAVAQTAFPERPITLVVPYGAGGTVDLWGRMLGEKLTEYWGQPVVVDNRPGAAGQVGTEHVASSDPDGYTWLVTASGHPISHLLYDNLPYDAFEDFTFVTQLGRGPLVMVVREDSQFETLAEFLEAAQAAPGELAYGHAGVGTSSHLSGALLADLAGVEFNDIPYRGGTASMADLLAGSLDFNFNIIPEAFGQLQDGSVRALGVTSAERTPALADVPAISETVPDYEFGAWWVIIGPAGVPEEIVEKMHEGLVRGLGEEDVLDRLATLGIEPLGTTPEEVEQLMDSERDTWARIFEAQGITPQ